MPDVCIPSHDGTEEHGSALPTLGLSDHIIFPRLIGRRSQLRLKLAHDFLESFENSREVGRTHIGTKRALAPSKPLAFAFTPTFSPSASLPEVMPTPPSPSPAHPPTSPAASAWQRNRDPDSLPPMPSRKSLPRFREPATSPAL